MTLKEHVTKLKGSALDKLNRIMILNTDHDTILLQREEWFEEHGKLEAYNQVLTAIDLIEGYKQEEK